MNTRTLRLNLLWYLTATFLVVAETATVWAEGDAEPRISITSQGLKSNRDSVENQVKSQDELPPLITSGTRIQSTRAGKQQKLSAGAPQLGMQALNDDFWIYSAGVELYSDQDFDGYYVGIDLTFDADTIYDVADVYAVLYLSYDFGPWNEYASTDDFAIYGASGDDEYFIETELVSGYLTGSYDILIELFDAYDGTFVASFGPDESSQLSYLPLEDIGRDIPRNTTVIIEEGGGSIGLLGLLVLLGVAGLTRRRACRQPLGPNRMCATLAGRTHDFSPPRGEIVEIDVQCRDHQQ